MGATQLKQISNIFLKSRVWPFFYSSKKDYSDSAASSLQLVSSITTFKTIMTKKYFHQIDKNTSKTLIKTNDIDQ